MKYTVEQIMRWEPCYLLEKVEDLVGVGLSANGLAHLDIPLKDRVWVLIRMLYDIKGKDAVVDFAGNCALRAYYYGVYVADAYTAYTAYAAYCADCRSAYAADADSANTAAAYSAVYAAERQWQIDYLVEAINMAQ